MRRKELSNQIFDIGSGIWIAITTVDGSGQSRLLDATCNGVPLLHDNLHKVNTKYEYCVRTNTIFSQYYPNR